MSDAGAALISIRPPYAEQILSGRKLVELRRRVPFAEPGMRLFIYATMPVGAVIGVVTLKQVRRDTPAAIWDELGALTAVTRPEFDAYFANTDTALGLLLGNPKRLPAAYIDTLRTLRSGFQPPQVMLRLSFQEAQALEFGT